MIVVKEFSCENKQQATTEEDRIMREMKATMNTLRAFLTDDERKEILHQYQNDNKELIKERKIKYCQNNKEKIQEYKQQYRQKTKEHIEEYGRQYYEKNKERIREYKNKNKEHIQQLQKGFVYVLAEKNILIIINYDTKKQNFILISLILVLIPTPLLLHSLNLHLRRFYPIR